MFNGFLTVVRQYITRRTGEGGALSYPRMTRSPAGSSKNISVATSPSKQELESKLMRKVKDKLSPVEHRAKLYERRSKLIERKQQFERHAGLTVGTWLHDILEGIDHLPAIEDAESLGEFGAKTERVGPGGETEGGILEWRSDPDHHDPGRRMARLRAQLPRETAATARPRQAVTSPAGRQGRSRRTPVRAIEHRLSSMPTGLRRSQCIASVIAAGSAPRGR